MKRDLICWDSCVLIDWITEGNPSRMASITPIVESITNGQYRLVVSSLVYVEVLECTMPEGTITKFENFTKNRDAIQIRSVDTRIARKAQTIRNFCHKNSKKISTPDAVHLATAIVCGANFFHTFDDRLLSLNETSEAEEVAITRCHFPENSRPLL